jgi:hypothetical protein
MFCAIDGCNRDRVEKIMVMPMAAAAAATSDVQTSALPAELVSAWERTLHGWQDRSLHDTVLGLAAKHEQFAWLAARYREVARRRPQDPVPAQRLARLQRAALATLCFAPPPGVTPERKPYRGAAIMLIAFVVLAVVGLRLVDMKTRGHQHAHPAKVVSKAR